MIKLTEGGFADLWGGKKTPEILSISYALQMQVMNLAILVEKTKCYSDIDKLNDWMRKKGFEYGETFYCWHDENNNTYGDFDIAWPYGVYGLQRCFTKPVAVKVDAKEEQIKAAEDFGYTLFTSIDEFKVFIEKNYGRRY